MCQISYDSHPYDVRLELDRMIKAGEIKKYIREVCHNRGIVFYVETDQGWNPEPIWCQWSEEDYYLHDAE